MSSEENGKSDALCNKKVKEYKTFFYFPFSVTEDALKKFEKDKGRWCHSPYELWDGSKEGWKDTGKTRNNQVLIYFHEYLRDVLFDSSDKGNDFLRYYTYCKDGKPVNYCDEFPIKINGRLTGFYISDIAMYIFESVGIGILTIGVVSESCTIDQALDFNQKFRLLYVSDIYQLGADTACPRIYKHINVDNLGLSAEFNYENNFYIEKSSVKPGMPSAPKKINNIVTSLMEPFLYKTDFSPILDDRMVLHTMLVFDKDKEAKLFCNDKLNALFSRLLYVDSCNGGYAYNKEFINSLMANNVYKRFADDTLYGFCRYADAMIGFDPDDYVIQNFSDVYYMTSVLALFYRCALIYYSKKVCDISKRVIQEDTNWVRNREIRRLRKSFLEFTNVWYFHEVTNQDMGIEMFAMQREAYQIDKLYKGVKEDIENLDDMIRIENMEQETNSLNLIARIGLPLAILAVLTGLFGMNMESVMFKMFRGEASWPQFKDSWTNFFHEPGMVPNIIFSVLALVTILIIFFIILFILRMFYKKTKRWAKRKFA